MADGNSAAAGSLLVGSFLYGIFHAASSGHGNIVLTTYLLTHPHKLSQGISIAAIGALCQGILAIILVYGLLYLAEWIPRETNTAVLWSERTSYTLMALIGALLILRIVRQELNRFFLKHKLEPYQTTTNTTLRIAATITCQAKSRWCRPAVYVPCLALCLRWASCLVLCYIYFGTCKGCGSSMGRWRSCYCPVCWHQYNRRSTGFSSRKSSKEGRIADHKQKSLFTGDC